jgi:hypothetical protein
LSQGHNDWAERLWCGTDYAGLCRTYGRLDAQ